MKKEIIKKISTGAKTLYDILDKIKISGYDVCLKIDVESRKIKAICENFEEQFSDSFRSKIKQEIENYVRDVLSTLKDLEKDGIIDVEANICNNNSNILIDKTKSIVRNETEVRIPLDLMETEVDEIISYCKKVFLLK